MENSSPTGNSLRFVALFGIGTKGVAFLYKEKFQNQVVYLKLLAKRQLKDRLRIATLTSEGEVNYF